MYSFFQKIILIAACIFLALPFLGAQDKASIETYIDTYFGLLNQVCDGQNEMVDKNSFKLDIMDKFYKYDETSLFNHLDKDATKVRKCEKYLEELSLRDIYIQHRFIDFRIEKDNNRTFVVAYVAVENPYSGGGTFNDTLDYHILIQQVKPSFRGKITFSEKHKKPKTRIDIPLPLEELKQNLVKVTGGRFEMGCTAKNNVDCFSWDGPVHTVQLGAFQISRYEVTQRQWKTVMGTNPSRHKDCDDCPVDNVSWEDVQEFLTKLNERTGDNYRLPTEAEWEYAARGGASSRGKKYSGSNNIAEVAWYEDISNNQTHEVGSKGANELGLYDMSGNVLEWCSDWYSNYSSRDQQEPEGPTSGSERVLRGGSWSSNADHCRIFVRYKYEPESQFGDYGFRVVKSL